MQRLFGSLRSTHEHRTDESAERSNYDTSSVVFKGNKPRRSPNSK